MEELISIIIPVHNSASFLEGCVQSALQQSWKNLQVILVDDGSEDGSSALCEEYARRDARIHVIRMEDRGVSCARNKGLEAAEGSYVTFLDADDRMHPLLLETLHTLLVKTESDIAGCSFAAGGDYAVWMECLMEENRKKGILPEAVQETPESGKVQTLTGEQFVGEKLLYSNTRIWSKLFRREVLEDRSFREGLTIGEDMLFLLETVLNGGCGENIKIAETEKALYFYYRNPMGAMERPFSPEYMDQLRCWQLAGERMRQSGCLNPDREARLASVRSISALLVTGKLARLSGKEFRRYRKQWEEARREALQQSGSGAALQHLSGSSRGRLFLLKHLPFLYRCLYQLK